MLEIVCACMAACLIVRHAYKCVYAPSSCCTQLHTLAMTNTYLMLAMAADLLETCKYLWGMAAAHLQLQGNFLTHSVTVTLILVKKEIQNKTRFQCCHQLSPVPASLIHGLSLRLFQILFSFNNITFFWTINFSSHDLYFKQK